MSWRGNTHEFVETKIEAVFIGSTVGIQSYRGQGYEGDVSGNRFAISRHLHLYVMVVLGAFWHRSRGLGPVEPWQLAEDATCPPTSSWWALETLVTLSRCGSGWRPSGEHGGGGGAIGGEIVPQPPSRVFFNTARLEGHPISEMWQELEKEVRLLEGSKRICLEIS